MHKKGVWRRKYFDVVAMGKIEKKMANYRNHRRFSIKCLKKEITPVSIKLKTHIHTRKALDIIRRAEKQLLDECIRTINNMIEMNMYRRDTYLHQLERVLDKRDYGRM